MRAEEERVDEPLQAEIAPSALRDEIEGACRGDAAAFRLLFERYHQRVYRYAFARMGRADEASDLVQDVFLSVWRALPSFTYEHEGSFPAWLFRIASRRLGDRVRQQVKRQTVPLDDAPEGRIEFEGLAVSRRLLADALAKLPARQREVLLLRFVAGLPVRDIAGSMGKSEAAVTALQMRGLAKLRRYIGRDDEG
jgi:RNA polymerase sigma-70 factor (ECF subfamily)